MTPRDGEPDTSTEASPEYAWRTHLAGRRPARSILAAAAFIALCGAVGVLYDSFVFAALGSAILFGSTSVYWLPRECRVHADRVEVVVFGRAFARPWSQFVACFRDSDAIFLSPTGSSTGLARFRGLTVFLPADADDVAAAIEHHVSGGRVEDGGA